MNTLATEKKRAALGALFSQLPALELQLIELLSVIFEPINRKFLINCMTDLGLVDQDGKRFMYKTLRPIINRLEEQSLLEPITSDGVACNRLIVEIATRSSIEKGRFELIAEIVHKHIQNREGWYEGAVNKKEQLIRDVRVGLYRGDRNFIQRQFQYWRKDDPTNPISLQDIYRLVYENPFDKVWLLRLPPDLFADVLRHQLVASVLTLQPAADYSPLLEEYLSKTDNKPQQDSSDWWALHLLLAELSIFRGAITEARQRLEGPLQARHTVDTLAVLGWLAFLQGETDAAISHYSQALRLLKRTTRKRRVYFNQIAGLFFVLALLKTNDPTRLQEALTHINTLSGHWLQPAYRCLKSIILMQQGRRKELDVLMNVPVVAAPANSVVNLISAVCIFWADSEAAKGLLQPLKAFHQKAVDAGYGWLAGETAGLLARLGAESRYANEAEAFCMANGTQTLLDTIKPQEAWELSLNALLNLPGLSPAAPKTIVQHRLAWFITFYEMTGTVHVEPREQKLTATGHWSKGRSVSLKRLSEPGRLDYLTPQDLKICRHIDTYNYGYYGQTYYEFADRTILDMVGHPHVYWLESPGLKVDIVKGEPELRVTKQENGQLILNIWPTPDFGKDFIAIKESPTRLKIITITQDHQRIAGILGDQGVTVPTGAQEQVLEVITLLSSLITVHSDIGAREANVESVSSDPRPHFLLLPFGKGLKVSLMIQPFGNEGPYYRPAMGGETVIAEIGGTRVRTNRRLDEEKRFANTAISACGSLHPRNQLNDEWVIEEPEDCLDLLLELQALGEQVVIEWPEGEKFKINYQVAMSQLHVKIKRSKDWFNLDGELKLDEKLVLKVHQMLDLVQANSGRFIPLGKGEFMALTHGFRKRLDELQAYSERHAQGLRFHPLATLALAGFTDEVGELQADNHWNEHVERLHEMQHFQPTLPSTLQAELREYQIDGFKWLARLAHWGVGACLADDMGLGKTVQALALILTRARHGPTLVVAPTSVCMNWITEADRFAPTLNVIQFGHSDRQQVLAELKPFDMLVCSYGLLQQDQMARILAEVKWKVIVLDEAQAIKNMATKRSQAAMRLQGEFKLITTGTPIENHLGELWVLFRFINPGLLGSYKSFTAQFVGPIERDYDRNVRNKLKSLVQPFILRRTKSQVLEELPPRTEILLHVDLSKEEMVFYEALRQRAVQSLSTLDVPVGQQHLQILAEIMKLRRACCNPRLVLATSSLPSSKLRVFGEVVEELLDNRHKALVFSQFVDHLSMIRDYLDSQNISYQYLDGSTPVRERKIRVDAFQAGNGDLFLISLKAGGTGLNLTAADYVIHMDPWWNPAVEDQASDRAHRIGQHRPVTIYRLVARNTIEDKIVDLHQHKRELAQSLLEGSDLSGRVSAVELLRLISHQ